MNLLHDFVDKQLKVADMIRVIDEYEQFEKCGIIGDSILRSTAEEYIKQLGVTLSVAALMRDITFECYKILFSIGATIDNYTLWRNE